MDLAHQKALLSTVYRMQYLDRFRLDQKLFLRFVQFVGTLEESKIEQDLVESDYSLHLS